MGAGTSGAAVDSNGVDPQEMPAYSKALDLYGKVYVQEEGRGFASYHFESPSRCYISYAQAPADWTLSDGSRVPAEKQFDQAKYDPATRTFTGTISWTPLTFDGVSSWDYEMRFSQDLTRISGGRVLSRPSGEKDAFGRDLQYRLDAEAGAHGPAQAPPQAQMPGVVEEP